MFVISYLHTNTHSNSIIGEWALIAPGHSGTVAWFQFQHHTSLICFPVLLNSLLIKNSYVHWHVHITLLTILCHILEFHVQVTTVGFTHDT